MSAMGKLKKGHVYFRITRWRSAFQSDLCGVLQSRVQEVREVWSVAAGTGEWTVFILPCSCACLSPAFKHAPVLQTRCLWLKAFRSLQLPPTPSWGRKVAKTMFWEWAGAWKRCQRGSWPWRAQTPLVQEDWFRFSFGMCAPLRLHKGSLLGRQTPRDRKWAATRDLFPLLLVKTCCGSLYCLNVFKLIWLSVCRVINELIGNLVGHLYFFLMFRYPMDLGGRNFLSTPQFL